MILIKIISAVVAFIMLMLPFGNNSTEKKCESKFNGLFIYNLQNVIFSS